MFIESEFLVRQGEGEKTGTDLLMALRSAQLGGDFSVMQGSMRPHELLQPHTHQHEDQVVIVLSGVLEFEFGSDEGMRLTAPAGSCVLKPRKIQHAFWTGEEPVRYIELSGRDGFENFIDATTRDGSVKAALDSSSRFGIHWNLERIPLLLLRHRLTSINGLNMPWEKYRTPGVTPEEVVEQLRRLSLVPAK